MARKAGLVAVRAHFAELLDRVHPTWMLGGVPTVSRTTQRVPSSVVRLTAGSLYVSTTSVSNTSQKRRLADIIAITVRSSGEIVYRFITVITAILCSSCAQLPYSPVPEPKQSGSHAVVFDIDGTLTPNVFAIFEMRVDAAKAVHAYSDKGYKIIYLSTRTGWISSGIPSWLMRHEFPEGSVHVAQNSEERQFPDRYKTRMLQKYLSAGWKVDYAFGDSSTDFLAYAAVGIPKERVFALLRRGQSDCQVGIAAACLADWLDHLAFVSSSVPNVSNQQSLAPNHSR